MTAVHAIFCHMCLQKTKRHFGKHRTAVFEFQNKSLCWFFGPKTLSSVLFSSFLFPYRLCLEDSLLFWGLLSGHLYLYVLPFRSESPLRLLTWSEKLVLLAFFLKTIKTRTMAAICKKSIESKIFTQLHLLFCVFFQLTMIYI